MPTETDKRAAVLAVSRYGADHAQVRVLLEAVHQAEAKGATVEILEMLVGESLLTRSQGEELRQDLEKTRLDLKPPDAAGSADPPAPVVNGAAASPPRAEPPLRVLGEYRLLRRLGEGGMGAVYLGYHERTHRQVAVKVLPDPLANQQAYLDRFRREAKSGLVLDHPNLVRFLAAGRDRASGKHFLVLEFVDGPSARSLLERFGRLTVGDAVHVCLDIARALEHLHSRNFIHRDIKPDNILITRSGVAKLADLGLAKRLDDNTHLTAQRQGVGTPFYMPYEQVISSKQVDGRCDIFALGATLYHLVTGDVPFPGVTPMEVAEKKLLGEFAPASTLNASVPAALDRVLERMLARHPRDRYQTVSELIVELERAGLAAPVPSFIDPDAALRDPEVRARLAPPQPTQADPKAFAPEPRTAPTPNPAPADAWYLRYRGRDGRWCKARGTTDQIRKRLHEGRLPAGAELCRTSRGDYRPVAAHPEFRPAPASRNGKDAPAALEGRSTAGVTASRLRRRLLWAAGVGVGILAALTAGALIALAR